MIKSSIVTLGIFPFVGIEKNKNEDEGMDYEGAEHLALMDKDLSRIKYLGIELKLGDIVEYKWKENKKEHVDAWYDTINRGEIVEINTYQSNQNYPYARRSYASIRYSIKVNEHSVHRIGPNDIIKKVAKL